MAIRRPLFLVICANCGGRYSTWPIKGNTTCYELHLVRVAERPCDWCNELLGAFAEGDGWTGVHVDRLELEYSMWPAD